MKLKKRTWKRILFVFMLLVTISNCIVILFGGNKVFADENGFKINEQGALFSLVDGLVWVLTLLIKLLAIIAGFIIQIILNAVGKVVDGSVDAKVTIENILFTGSNNSKLPGIQLLDINFFEVNSGPTTVQVFRKAVAGWYYILLTISAAALLVMLIYIGIRMAISTVASEEAKYKKMLVDWATSMALVFVLHYIILFFITINETLVSAIAKIATNSTLVRWKNNRCSF